MARAQIYRLLATLLAGPPDGALLSMVGRVEADPGTDLGRALVMLADTARAAAPEPAEREYNRLFIGVGRGELVPYASYYLSGFLMDRPLIAIRQEMNRLGLTRAERVSEPEDHIAAELEIMAGLITGDIGAERDQRPFFERHLRPWAPTFFRDLERAEGAALYRPVGRLGRTFLQIEQQGFAFMGPGTTAQPGITEANSTHRASDAA